MLEKILKEKRKELGPLPEDDDVASPKLKLSKTTLSIAVLPLNTCPIQEYRLADSSF